MIWGGDGWINAEFNHVVTNYYVSVEDLALMSRSAKATIAYRRSQAQKQYQDQLEKSKQTKPTL
jgi:hypothetical protein